MLHELRDGQFRRAQSDDCQDVGGIHCLRSKSQYSSNEKRFYLERRPFTLSIASSVSPDNWLIDLPSPFSPAIDSATPAPMLKAYLGVNIESGSLSSGWSLRTRDATISPSSQATFRTVVHFVDKRARTVNAETTSKNQVTFLMAFEWSDIFRGGTEWVAESVSEAGNVSS